MKNCDNHLLASKIRRMFRNDNELNDVLERIHDLLKAIKGNTHSITHRDTHQ